MEGNSRLPGVATDPLHAARARLYNGRAQLTNALANLEHALGWASDAVVPGQYYETLLPAWLWAIDKAAHALDDHLVGMPSLKRRVDELAGIPVFDRDLARAQADLYLALSGNQVRPLADFGRITDVCG